MNKYKISTILTFLVIIIAGLGFVFWDKKEVVGVVVPHHNVVEDKRLEFLTMISEKKFEVKKVVLISPDHFSNYQKEISYSDRDWELSKGILEYDVELGRQLVDGLSKNNNLVKDDHGIFNILADIKQVFPGVKIVPILVGQEVEFEELNDLINKISYYCGRDCLLIASVDFSHYLPYKLADIHDVKTEKYLSNLDEFEIGDIEVDSPQSLHILTEIAKRKNANWNKFWHSNSTKMEEIEDLESTSHFMGYYEVGLKFKEENEDYTYCVGRNLSKEENLDSLGERFFYGVDYINFDLEKDFGLNGEIDFVISGETYFDRQKMEIGLSEDLVVCGVLGEKPLFLPIYEEDGKKLLMRGKEKQEFLTEFELY